MGIYNLIGKKFGSLTVVEMVGVRNHNALWKCQCRCGKFTEKITNSLYRYKNISCGCWVMHTLKYSPTTGMFYRNGIPVTGKTKCGYHRIHHRRRHILAHRLAWEMIHGPIPEGMQIDHINRIRDDNRIDNLRLVSSAENRWNSEGLKGSTSKYKGVSYVASKRKWIAQCSIGGVAKYLGQFDHEIDAAYAYNSHIQYLNTDLAYKNII